MFEEEGNVLPPDIWTMYLDFENFYLQDSTTFPDFLDCWDSKLERLISTRIGLTYSDTLLGLKLLERCTLKPAETQSIIFSSGAFKAIKSQSFLRFMKHQLLMKYQSFETTEADGDTIKVEFEDVSDRRCKENDVPSCITNGSKNKDEEKTTFQCDECNEVCEDLKKHRKSCGKPYRCTLCNKIFGRQYQLTEHLLSHESVKPDSLNLGDEQIFSCEVCNKMFTSDSRLKKHELIHTGVRPFSCDQCPKSFKKSSHLKEHKIYHNNVRAFKCDTCEKSFYHSKDLKKHELRHKENKPFVCDLCGKGFIRIAELNIHRRTHEPDDKKPYQCEVCNKGFVLTHDFERHRMIHTGEKPFTCQVCGKGFIRNSILKRHMRLHSEDPPAIVIKPFKCDQCARTFRNKTELTTHHRYHTRENLFKCDICSKEFVLKVCLKRHLKIHAYKEQMYQPQSEALELHPR